MDGQIEAAGAFATAAGAAAAIEHERKAGTDPVAGTPDNCPNCGALVTGAFCAACGQRAHVHRSLAHAAEELVHGVWHFDSKLWRTLPMLAVRPGQLTRDYVMGKRARYISPFALFLLTIFLMFFVFSFAGAVNFNAVDTSAQGFRIDPADSARRIAEIDRSIADNDRNLAAARKDPARADEIPTLELSRQALVAGRKLATDVRDGKLAPSNSPVWASTLKAAIDSGTLRVNLPNESLNEKVRRTLGNPELALYKIQQKGYKLSFLLLPLSLPWLMLLFAGKRHVRAYDHVVFLLYSISFMSLIVVATALLGIADVFSGLPYVLLILVAPPIHMFFQMKGAYRLSTFSALWRTMLLVAFALVTLALYFSLILALGLIE